ncbi:MAG: DUF1127 domain-containing protein [Marinomonas sp.]
MALLTSTQKKFDLTQVDCLRANGLENLVSRFSKLMNKINHNWRTRKQLGRLNQAALKDIGLSQADVAHELEKPLWK